jgi:nitrogen regulatory protein P-II 1
MKMIVAIIQPYKLTDVKQALFDSEIHLMTVSNVLGSGRQLGHTETYRGVPEEVNLLKKVKIEIAVNEDFVKPAIDAITKGARTGEIGDGKIFIFDLPECMRIRTGETGSEAIGK